MINRYLRCEQLAKEYDSIDGIDGGTINSSRNFVDVKSLSETICSFVSNSIELMNMLF